jgi:hypothetical protein
LTVWTDGLVRLANRRPHVPTSLDGDASSPEDALHILECALDREHVIRGILSAWFRLQAAVVYRQSAGAWEHLNKIGARSSAVRRGRTLRSVALIEELRRKRQKAKPMN